MFGIFDKNKKNYISQRSDISYQFKTLQRYMVLDLSRINTYYRNTKRFVNSKDFIYRLMKFYGLDVETDFISYITSIDRNLKLTHRHFKIASYYNHGEFNNDNIYYMEYTKEYDVFDDVSTLLDIPPIEMLSSDTNSLFYQHPLKVMETFSIRGIDIRLLLIQYYHWYRLRSQQESDNTYKRFIDNIVYPNQLKSIADTAIINRFIFPSDDIIDFNQHPFHVNDLTSKLDTLIKKYNKNHSKGAIPAVDMLREIPTIDSTALQHLQIKYPPMNSYNSVGYFFIYARIMEGVYNKLNGKSKRLFKSRMRSENIMFMKMRSLDIRRIDFGELTEEKDRLFDFFINIL